MQALLVHVTQDTTCSVHYVPDAVSRKHPVRRYRRVQLREPVKLEFSTSE
jgi:hypothetical protein